MLTKRVIIRSGKRPPDLLITLYTMSTSKGAQPSDPQMIWFGPKNQNNVTTALSATPPHAMKLAPSSRASIASPITRIEAYIKSCGGSVPRTAAFDACGIVVNESILARN